MIGGKNMLIDLLVFTVKALIVGAIATGGYILAAAYSVGLAKAYLEDLGVLPENEESE